MVSSSYHLLSLLLLLPLAHAFFQKGPELNVNGVQQKSSSASYGVDVSYAIHYGIDRKTHHGKRYYDLVDGCAKAYSARECDVTEKTRLAMNRDQPRTQHNYTATGFLKRKVPDSVYQLIRSFYDANKEKKHVEQWSRGYTYTNHWVSPTYMVSPEDSSLRGGGTALKNAIWNGITPVIEEWTGHKVKPTSLYGVRIYTEGAILATHVDRLPLVSSCIINVDQDVREPWPIEVYDHDGVAHNVTMEPGDMVLYESHTVLHGRPFPLHGNHYANMFVHFEPVDHKQMNELDRKNQHFDPKIQVDKYDNEEEEEEDVEAEIPSDPKMALHVAAAQGQLGQVKALVQRDMDAVNFKDKNGWQPLHEAVRGGHTPIVKYLIDMGADMGARTSSGGSPLWWAKRSLPRDHSTIRYLESIGAPEDGDL